MKALLVVSALFIGFVTIVFVVSRTATITDEEREICDAAIGEVHSYDVTRLRDVSYRINVGTNGRRVEIIYPGDSNRPSFICAIAGDTIRLFDSSPPALERRAPRRVEERTI